MGVLDDIYGGKWLKAGSLEDDTPMEITAWEIHAFDDGQKQIALSFRGMDKRLGLNKTNANMIAEITKSENPDDWIGTTIVVGPDKTEMGGKIVDCVRVRYQKSKPAAAKTAPETPTTWDKRAAWAEWKRVWNNATGMDAAWKTAFGSMGKSVDDMTEADWKALADAAGPALDSAIPF